MRLLIKIIFTIAPFLYMGLIWILSSMPDNVVIQLSDEKLDGFFKESLHLIEFAILYILFIVALLVNKQLIFPLHIASAIVAIFYGFIDEIHQAFIPFRSATLIDAIKDMIGVFVLAFIVHHTYFSHRENKISQLMHKVERWVNL
ncbi:VanZ family protein [Oikeobacillus pervagus]|nr:VanZ family protein [Oikeobacillus pervagus]